MKNRNLLIKAAGLALLMAASSSFAVMSIPYGWYIDGNIGSSHVSNVNYPGSTSLSGLGENANLGYKFMPFFATEVGYTRYANTTISNTSNVKVASVRQYSYGISGKGMMPVADSGLEFFGKVGVARVSAKLTTSDADAAAALGVINISHTATGLYYGIGAQYAMIPALGLTVQWQRAQGSRNTGNMDLLSGGISFIFG